MRVDSIYHSHNDEPRWRKKSKKKPPKKADHKHTYHNVILHGINQSAGFDKSRGFFAAKEYIAGHRCDICGRLEYGFIDGLCGPVSSYVDYPTPTGKRRVNILNPEFAEMPIVEIGNVWELKEENKKNGIYA